MPQHPMNLAQIVVPASDEKVSYSGRVTGFEVNDGQTLKIETSPSGAEILSRSPPAGKKWNANIVVQIVETDA